MPPLGHALRGFPAWNGNPLSIHFAETGNRAMLIVAIRSQVVLLLLLVGGWGAWAQPTNLDLVRDCTRSVADSALALAAASTLCYTVAAHPGAWILEEAVAQSATQRGNRLRDCSTGTPTINIAFTELSVLYRNGAEQGAIARECRVGVVVMIAPTGAEPPRQQEFTAIRHDTVAVSAVALIEQPGYEYLRGVSIAQNSSNFWDKVIEPAIVLGAAAVSVILLFTVRSN